MPLCAFCWLGFPVPLALLDLPVFGSLKWFRRLPAALMLPLTLDPVLPSCLVVLRLPKQVPSRGCVRGRGTTAWKRRKATMAPHRQPPARYPIAHPTSQLPTAHTPHPRHRSHGRPAPLGRRGSLVLLPCQCVFPAGGLASPVPPEPRHPAAKKQCPILLLLLLFRPVGDELVH